MFVPDVFGCQCRLITHNNRKDIIDIIVVVLNVSVGGKVEKQTDF